MDAATFIATELILTEKSNFMLFGGHTAKEGCLAQWLGHQHCYYETCV